MKSSKVTFTTKEKPFFLLMRLVALVKLLQIYFLLPLEKVVTLLLQKALSQTAATLLTGGRAAHSVF